MELQGTIKFIGQTEQVSATFQKRDVVIMTEESSQYPQPILVQFTQAKCDELNTYQDKQTGKIKYFNTIQGWRITAVGVQQQYQAPQQQQFQQPQHPQQGQQQFQPQGNDKPPF